MDDLVERLRGLNAEYPPFGAAHEAADEIERLSKQVSELSKELQAADDELNDFAECIAINRMLEKQVAELREALQKIKHHMDTDEYAWEVATEALARTAPKEE